jgi:hypothetical protein
MLIRLKIKQIRPYLGVGTSANFQFENKLIKKIDASPIISIERILAISYNDFLIHDLPRFRRPHGFVTLEPIELSI